jgi:hypothetical protein
MLCFCLENFIIVLLSKDVFNGFKVHVTKLILPEVLEVLGSITKLIFIDIFVD